MSTAPEATAQFNAKTPVTVTHSEPFELPFLPQPGVCTTFSNGHRLVFVPRQGQVFNISTWVGTGSLHEDEQNNGVSHFLEHLMFKGTPRFEPGVFDKTMENMGGIINAATWKDYTFYYITGPNTDYGEFDKALDMHADMLLHANLPEEEIGEPYDPAKGETPAVKRERGVVIEEIGMCEDRPWNKVYTALNDLMYPEGHPYRREVIGTRTIVGTIPREAILAYYRRWYTPEVMTTTVVGDFDYAVVEEKVKAAFNFHERPDAAPVLAHYTEPPAPQSFLGQVGTGDRHVERQGEYSTRFLLFGFHGPQGTTAKELKELDALSVASYVLGESLSSRLNQNLVEKVSPSSWTTLGSMMYNFKLGNVLLIQGNFAGSDTQAAMAEVTEQLRLFLDGPNQITAEEFERTIKKLKVGFARSVETCAGLGEALGESLTVYGNLEAFTHALQRFNQLTLEDVKTVAQRYLQPSLAYSAVLVPQTHA
jgi:zinc protease